MIRKMAYCVSLVYTSLVYRLSLGGFPARAWRNETASSQLHLDGFLSWSTPKLRSASRRASKDFLSSTSPLDSSSPSIPVPGFLFGGKAAGCLRDIGVDGTGIPLKNGLAGADGVTEDGDAELGLSALARCSRMRSHVLVFAELFAARMSAQREAEAVTGCPSDGASYVPIHGIKRTESEI